MLPSQSSSAPLQDSAGGLQVPHAQELLHVREPVDPHEVVQDPVSPRQHSPFSSQEPSQSSSTPLQVSAGGTQLPQVQELEHVLEPVELHEVVQVPEVPRQHSKPLSQPFTQSSSTPLHVSAGGTQLPQSQEALQVCRPVVPQLVGQLRVSPWKQCSPVLSVQVP